MACRAGPVESRPRSAVSRSGYTHGHSTRPRPQADSPASSASASSRPGADRANGPGAAGGDGGSERPSASMESAASQSSGRPQEARLTRPPGRIVLPAARKAATGFAASSNELKPVTTSKDPGA